MGKALEEKAVGFGCAINLVGQLLHLPALGAGKLDLTHPALPSSSKVALAPELGVACCRSVVDAADLAVRRVEPVGNDDVGRRLEAVADRLDRTFVAARRKLLEGEVVCHAPTLRTPTVDA